MYSHHVGERRLFITSEVLRQQTRHVNQGSHTSQIRKFKGISRAINGSTAHFQRYFWKTVVTLLYVNKISSNISHLLQNMFWHY